MDVFTQAQSLVSQMTLREKTSLLSGADNWRTKRISRLNLPSATVSDGPHGLRKEVDVPKQGRPRLFVRPGSASPRWRRARARSARFRRRHIARAGVKH